LAWPAGQSAASEQQPAAPETVPIFGAGDRVSAKRTYYFSTLPDRIVQVQKITPSNSIFRADIPGESMKLFRSSCVLTGSQTVRLSRRSWNHAEWGERKCWMHAGLRSLEVALRSRDRLTLRIRVCAGDLAAGGN